MRVTRALLAALLVCASSSSASAALLTFDNRADFDLAAPGLPVETFEEAAIPPALNVSFDSPLNSATDNLYFDPGDILTGLEVSVVSFGLFGGSAGVFGLTSDVVGANVFSDTLNLNFTSGTTTAVGLDLFSLFDASNFTVSVFGAGDVLLDSFGVAVSNTGTFFGVLSDAGPITRIHLSSDTGWAEGVDNIAFGTVSAVPEPASMLLLGTGLVAVARRYWRNRL